MKELSEAAGEDARAMQVLQTHKKSGCRNQLRFTQIVFVCRRNRVTWHWHDWQHRYTNAPPIQHVVDMKAYSNFWAIIGSFESPRPLLSCLLHRSSVDLLEQGSSHWLGSTIAAHLLAQWYYRANRRKRCDRRNRCWRHWSHRYSKEPYEQACLCISVFGPRYGHQKQFG